MPTKKSPIRLDEPCPCQSGKKYKDCCAGKKFRWMRDEAGEVYIEAPILEPTYDVLERQLSEFKGIFGRKPGKNDKVFVQQYLYSEEDFDDEVYSSASEAGVDPRVIYATLRTGRFVTDENLGFIPDSEILEWKAAIREYDELIEDGKDPFLVLRDLTPDIQDAYRELILDTYASIVHFGSFLENIPRNRRISEASFFQYYCAARSLDTLRTIYRLHTSRYADDVFILVRSLYENYLRIMFVRQHPEKSLDFFAMYGVALGTHEYEKRKNGKINRRVIVEKESGRRFEGHISNRRMAESSDLGLDVEFYDQIYDFFSTYAHPDMSRIRQFFDPDGGFKTHPVSEPFLNLQLVSLVCALTFDELRLTDHVLKRTRRDLLFIALRLKERLLGVYRLVRQRQPNLGFGELIEERTKLIGIRSL